MSLLVKWAFSAVTLTHSLILLYQNVFNSFFSISDLVCLVVEVALRPAFPVSPCTCCVAWPLLLSELATPSSLFGVMY